MRVRVASAVLCVALLAMTSSLSAHHAFTAEFDGSKPIELVGTVTMVEWINPHSWVHMDVKRPDGTVEKWMVELGTVGTLVRLGLTKNLLPPGTEIKISGFLAKDGSKKANGRTATFADGRSFGLGSSAGAGVK